MVKRAKTMGLDGSSEKAVNCRAGTKLSKTSKGKLLSPPVENFNGFASLLKQTFTKPNATNGNHKGTIRTFYPHRRS